MQCHRHNWRSLGHSHTGNVVSFHTKCVAQIHLFSRHAPFILRDAPFMVGSNSNYLQVVLLLAKIPFLRMHSEGFPFNSGGWRPSVIRMTCWRPIYRQIACSFCVLWHALRPRKARTVETCQCCCVVFSSRAQKGRILRVAWKVADALQKIDFFTLYTHSTVVLCTDTG